MKRTVRAATALCLIGIAALAAPALAGGPLEIEFRDTEFDPSNPPPRGVSPAGEEVVWVGPEVTLDHNIHQDSRLFHSGAPGATKEYHEDISAGRYHYFCQVHGSRAGGMDGVVKIKPTVVLPDGDSVRVIWADSAAEPNHRFEVQFRRPSAEKWRTWKRATAQTLGEFGEGNDPINANPNKTYQLRVRTFVKGKRKQRHSGWARVPVSVAP